jgi:subtilase family serine protease
MSRATHRLFRQAASTAAIALGGAALLSAVPSAGAAASAPAGHHVVPSVGVHPHVIRAGNPQTHGSVVFSCQTPAPGGVQCYGPDQIRAAYNIQPLLDRGLTGKGRTIVVVDAFNPPGVAADLHTFDAVWGLADPELTILNPQGSVPFDLNSRAQTSFASEIDLDLQWAHVVAPDAKLVLVEAKTNDDADILAATQFAVQHRLGDVISQSFGEDESCVAPDIAKAQHRTFEQATAEHITLIASSGDQGSALPTCDGSTFSKAVSSPASDPLVLAIGGTHLLADGTSGAYQSETVWNESERFGAAGGGGFSVKFRRPAYEIGVVRSTARGLPDVSYNAAIDGGVIAFFGQDGLGGNFYLFGGTSAGSPQWSGLIAITNQLAHRQVGFVNSSLYAAQRAHLTGRLLHDITVGDNTFTFTNEAGATVTIPGFAAVKGWDAATGLGTPKANAVVPFLALAG